MIPEITGDAVRIALLILPGFLAVQVRDVFVPRRDISDFERFMEALAFAAASFAIASLLILAGLRLSSLSFFLAGATIAVVLGLGMGVVAGKDWLYRAARATHLTNRTGRKDVWQDSFADIEGCWLLVYLDDGSRLMGWARYYSETGSNPSMFLAQASWVAQNKSLVPIEGPGILLTESSKIRYMEFLREEDDGN